MNTATHDQAQDVLERYALLSKWSREIILFISLDGRIEEANDAACRAYGYDREELLGLNIKDLRALHTRALIRDQMAQALEKGILFETEHVRKNGTVFPVEVSSGCAQIGEERILLSIIHDITERKRAETAKQELETRLNRAQKLEAIAILAGGIAHDFNNWAIRLTQVIHQIR